MRWPAQTSRLDLQKGTVGKISGRIMQSNLQRADDRNEESKMKVKMLLSITASDVIQEFNDARSEGRGHEEVHEAWDDVTGEKIARGEVLKARAVEL